MNIRNTPFPYETVFFLLCVVFVYFLIGYIGLPVQGQRAVAAFGAAFSIVYGKKLAKRRVTKTLPK